MDKTVEKPKERPQNKNLKTDAGPGRPLGQRNYATIYREALLNIARVEGKTLEEIETMIEQVGLEKAMKGDFAFWKDVRDRIHGKPVQPIAGDKDNPVVVKVVKYE